MTAVDQDGSAHNAARPLLRGLVRDAIEGFLPADELRRLNAIGAAERESLTRFAEVWRTR